MKKKSLMLCAVSLVAVALIGVGGTLAYFTDREEATNVVTMGHVDIELDEPNYQPGEDGVYENVVPNMTITKDPTITVEEGSEDCYVRAKLEITGLEGLVKDNTTYADMLLAGININTEDWYLGEDGYYYYNEKMEAGDSVSLFTTVKIPEKWGNEVVGREFDIVVSAEAIQFDNFAPTTNDNGMITAWKYEDGSAITAETYNTIPSETTIVTE